MKFDDTVQSDDFVRELDDRSLGRLADSVCNEAKRRLREQGESLHPRLRFFAVSICWPTRILG